MKIYLQWHLGLGDAIICNGLVRTIAPAYEKLVLPAYIHNCPTVSNMFVDLLNVEVRCVESDEPRVLTGENIVPLGMFRDDFNVYEAGGETFDQAFYRQLKVPIENRWDYFQFPYPPPHELVKPPEQHFVVIHEDEKRGFILNHDVIAANKGRVGKEYFEVFITPEQTPNLLNWVGVLKAAAEVHCFDSSILHLCESIPLQAQLFWHKCARDNGPFHYPMLRKRWNIIEGK